MAVNAVFKGGFERINQATLDEAIKKHIKFMRGIQGGRRLLFRFKDLTGLNFRGADLSQADISGSIAKDAYFSYANMSESGLFACDLSGAHFEKTNLKRADLRGSIAVDTNFSLANLHHADLREGAVEDMESRPTSTRLLGARLCDANLEKVKATRTIFCDSDLSGANFEEAECTGADFRDANFSGAKLTNTILANANLEGAIFKNTVLYGTDLEEARMDDIVHENHAKTLSKLNQPFQALLKSHMAWIESSGREGQRLDLTDYDLRALQRLNNFKLMAMKGVGTYFIGLDLQKIGLHSALLDYADFRYANLQGADFTGASLKCARLTHTNLRGAKFTPLRVQKPGLQFWLKRADLTRAKLRFMKVEDADFSHAILRGADLSYTSFRDCDLSNADLTGANLDGTDFKGSVLNNTVFEGKEWAEAL